MYIEPHDMRTNIVSVRGGGAYKKKKKEREKRGLPSVSETVALAASILFVRPKLCSVISLVLFSVSFCYSF